MADKVFSISREKDGEKNSNFRWLPGVHAQTSGIPASPRADVGEEAGAPWQNDGRIGKVTPRGSPYKIRFIVIRFSVIRGLTQ